VAAGARPTAGARRGSGVGREPAPPAPPATPRPAPTRDWLPWLLLAAVLAVWLVEAQGGLWRTSHWCHYLYLADAFNHGQLHLYRHPHDAGDMAIFQNRAYVVYGPVPALPLMPLVAFLGPRTPDVLILVLTALFATYAFHRLLAAVHGRSDRWVRACVTLSLALGTAVHYGAPMANVWLHAQISALALQCWALWMAARGRAWWTGVALALTVLTRPTAALAAPLAAWLLARPCAPAGGAAPRARSWPAVARALGIPIAAAAVLHALYNLARFGSVTDAGYGYILSGDEFHALVAKFGFFSLHFLPQNLYGWLLRPPQWQGGALVPDPHGMSLLLSVPVLWLLLVPRKLAALEWVALATCAVIAAPSLLYYNDGWVQFGQRFALDWIAPGLLACSFAARRAPAWLTGLLTAAGIVVNAWGMLWFQAGFLH
jgi:hypothetical protein